MTNADGATTNPALFEVELKFPIRDETAVKSRLAEWGAVWSSPSEQRDCYFAHPGRNFAETDEALRTRTVDEVTTLTYKGPVLDRATKTRREIEVDLVPGREGEAALRDILQQLGFIPVREVCKLRCKATIHWEAQAIELGWDQVEPLGTYLELEVVTSAEGTAAAQQLILDVARRLELGRPEPRSYLDMLLARDGIHPAV